MANGRQLETHRIASARTYLILGGFFLHSIREFGAVLGVNWLCNLGPISWDFKHTRMKFSYVGNPVTLHKCSLGQPSAYSLSLVEGADQQLRHELEVLFDEPVGLPPARACSHMIYLLHGTDPVVVRPYRYPHGQKDEIEKQCAYMLTKGIIRPSTSLFSSPVLLVRNTDNSWRFCVDLQST